MSSLPDMAQDENLVKFETGAVRTTSTKMYSYARISPIALRALARTYAEGVQKYESFNCERGMSVENLLGHAVDHIYSFLEGDRSEDHLGHALWNVAQAIHSYVLWPHLNRTLRRPGCRPALDDLDDSQWAGFEEHEQPSKSRYAGSHNYWDKLESDRLAADRKAAAGFEFKVKESDRRESDGIARLEAAMEQEAKRLARVQMEAMASALFRKGVSLGKETDEAKNS